MLFVVVGCRCSLLLVVCCLCVLWFVVVRFVLVRHRWILFVGARCVLLFVVLGCSCLLCVDY